MITARSSAQRNSPKIRLPLIRHGKVPSGGGDGNAEAGHHIKEAHEGEQHEGGGAAALDEQKLNEVDDHDQGGEAVVDDGVVAGAGGLEDFQIEADEAKDQKKAADFKAPVGTGNEL